MDGTLDCAVLRLCPVGTTVDADGLFVKMRLNGSKSEEAFLGGSGEPPVSTFCVESLVDDVLIIKVRRRRGGILKGAWSKSIDEKIGVCLFAIAPLLPERAEVLMLPVHPNVIAGGGALKSSGGGDDEATALGLHLCVRLKYSSRSSSAMSGAAPSALPATLATAAEPHAAASAVSEAVVRRSRGSSLAEACAACTTERGEATIMRQAVAVAMHAPGVHKEALLCSVVVTNYKLAFMLPRRPTIEVPLGIVYNVTEAHDEGIVEVECKDGRLLRFVPSPGDARGDSMAAAALLQYEGAHEAKRGRRSRLISMLAAASVGGEDAGGSDGGGSGDAESAETWALQRCAVCASLCKTLKGALYASDEKLFAFVRGPAAVDGGTLPPLYDAEREYRRMGCTRDSSSNAWRLWPCNFGHSLVRTYPELLVVPASVRDDTIVNALTFRSRGRIPVVTWRSSRPGCAHSVIARCAQPLVGIARSRCLADEELCNEIRRAALPGATAPAAPPRGGQRAPLLPLLYVLDARPRLNASANGLFKGAGYEGEAYAATCELLFLDIDNIHVMRKSLAYLQHAVRATHDWEEGGMFSAHLAESGWLEHLGRVLRGAVMAAQVVDEGASVLVHCSDGWDRTAQIVSLAQILLDPYYRTAGGFGVLVEKDWCAFGHKFSQRLGHGGVQQRDQYSPVFVQFVDAVAQLLLQFPRAFEFNEAYLVALLDAAFSCRFGTFLFDSDAERESVRSRLEPVWPHLCDVDVSVSAGGGATHTAPAATRWRPKPQFANSAYEGPPAADAPSTLLPSLKRLRLWEAWHLRWALIDPPRIGAARKLTTAGGDAPGGRLRRLTRTCSARRDDDEDEDDVSDVLSPLAPEKVPPLPDTLPPPVPEKVPPLPDTLPPPTPTMPADRAAATVVSRQTAGDGGGTDDGKTGGATALMLHKKEWMKDGAVANCVGCSKRFSMTRRRHHCRMCGMLFCSSCSNFKANLDTSASGLADTSAAATWAQALVEATGSSTEERGERVCERCFIKACRG